MTGFAEFIATGVFIASVCFCTGLVLGKVLSALWRW